MDNERFVKYGIGNLIRVVYSLILVFAGVISCYAQQNASYFPPKINGAVPYSNLHFNDSSSKVQFAIVSDLWGGYRPGIFEDAVKKIELLQPQFVISVGDLIDGETYDTSLINKEWKAFDVKLEPLTMPFFYVPGNHDIGNPLMENIWKDHFGSPYYYFIYKDVLFLCVNTQDGGYPTITTKQVSYFKKVIHEHPNVRWTFIFMHRPVWYYKEKNDSGFLEIENFLKDYNYTVFSGHHHTYLYVHENGKDYYMLATTGGKSPLYGPKFGLFDEIVWVTLNKKGPPQVINLALNGLFGKDLVTNKEEPIDSLLVYQNWLITPSFVAEKQFEKEIKPVILFNNTTGYPLHVFGKLPDSDNYQISPNRVNLMIEPHSRIYYPITVSSRDNRTLNLLELNSIKITLTGAIQYDSMNYQLPASKTLLLNWKYIISEQAQAKDFLYRQFKNGDSTGFISVLHPEYIKDHWYWNGSKDGLISFKLAHDKKYLYLAAFIFDDHLNLNGDDLQRDVLNIDFEDKDGAPAYFKVFPEWNNHFRLSESVKNSALPIKSVKLTGEVQDSSLCKIFFQIPLDEIEKPDHSIRFNIGYRVHDNTPEKDAATPYWKPLWGSMEDYKNSGTFIIGNKEKN